MRDDQADPADAPRVVRPEQVTASAADSQSEDLPELWILGDPVEVAVAGPASPGDDQEPPHPRTVGVAADEDVADLVTALAAAVGIELSGVPVTVASRAARTREVPDLLPEDTGVTEVTGLVTADAEVSALEDDAHVPDHVANTAGAGQVSPAATADAALALLASPSVEADTDPVAGSATDPATEDAEEQAEPAVRIAAAAERDGDSQALADAPPTPGSAETAPVDLSDEDEAEDRAPGADATEDNPDTGPSPDDAGAVVVEDPAASPSAQEGAEVGGTDDAPRADPNTVAEAEPAIPGDEAAPAAPSVNTAQPPADPPASTPNRPRAFTFFGRRAGRGTQRKLAAHTLDMYAGKPTSLRKVDAALARLEPADPTGAVTAYRTELRDLAAEQPALPAQRLHMLLRESGVAGQLRAMDDQPAAVGAIGQVHRGEWMDGTAVAVKVMHPGVWETFPAEARELLGQASAIGRHLPGVDVPKMLTRIAAGTANDVDFNAEAARQHAFYAAFCGTGRPHPDVTVPRVLLVAPTVLITGWADAAPLTDALGGLDEAARARAARGISAFAVTGLVETGMVHGDLHPGNVLVTADGTVTPVDFAHCVPAPVRLPDAASALIRAARTGDAQAAMRALRDLGVVTAKSGMKDPDALAAAVALTGPLDTDAFTADTATLSALAAAGRRLRGPVVNGPLEATVDSFRDALALTGRLTVPVDVRAAVTALPGLGEPS